MRLTFLALSALLTLSAAAAASSPAVVGDRAEAAPVADKNTATGIEWEVGPAHVQIFLDGKKIGDAGALKFTATNPGKHQVKLVNGKDETEMEVNVKKGQKVKFSFQFDAG